MENRFKGVRGFSVPRTGMGVAVRKRTATGRDLQVDLLGDAPDIIDFDAGSISRINAPLIARQRSSTGNEGSRGRVRMEVCVDKELSRAIYQMAEAGSTSIKSIMEDLLRTWLRIEEQVPATPGFWKCIRGIADRYR